MNMYYNNAINVLQQYVGKTYNIDYCDVEIVMLLGGESGPAFFLCKWAWSGIFFCSDPLEVLPHFDDNINPLEDILDTSYDE